MASTAKSAVSDYEHLKYRYGNENQNHLNESEDEDFLPLKSKIRELEDQISASAFPSSNQIHHHPVSHKYNIDNLDSIASVPLQSPWSPGMMVKPNPSLFITPEKEIKSSYDGMGVEKDNILEPRDLNQVPAPFSWSPCQLAKPSIVMTPEKPGFTATINTQKSAFAKDTMKSKEKQSVRFDLPSSGDDLTDCSALSDPLSPITIKGKNLRSQGDVGLNDSSCPSKAYNPMAYSDELCRDFSLENSKKLDDNDSLSTATNLVEKLNQLLESSKNFDDLKNVTHSTSMMKLSTVDSAPHTSVSCDVSDQIKLAPLDGKKTAASGSRSSKHLFPHVKKTKPGPHHLSSSVSPYYPPNSGACVVREAKHPMISTDYSYPFKNTENNEEYEHIFSRPEYNSSLKVRSELDNLCDVGVDVEKAVQVKLSKSSTKKTEIQEKAAFYTNHVCDQFMNLVDVEPSIDRLCDRVVRMRTGSKAASHKKETKIKKELTSQAAPDLMEFYSADLQRESPDLSLPGVLLSTPVLQGAPHDQAFECYRHTRVWGGLQDF